MRHVRARTPLALCLTGRVLLCALPLVVANASGDEPTAPLGWEEVEARKKADVAARLLTATLLAELTAAIEKGGVPEAVRVCSDAAQKVTRDLGAREGVTVRRTGLRVRNPANAPDDFERVWLERAQQEVAAGRAPVPTYDIVPRSDGGRELRHLRPIIFPGGLCSQCHGGAEEISDEVGALLRQRYPRDRATGFAPGDLRGAISVHVPLRGR